MDGWQAAAHGRDTNGLDNASVHLHALRTRHKPPHALKVTSSGTPCALRNSVRRDSLDVQLTIVVRAPLPVSHLRVRARHGEALPEHHGFLGNTTGAPVPALLLMCAHCVGRGSEALPAPDHSACSPVLACAFPCLEWVE